MAKLVDAEWLAARIGSEEIVLLDPRRPMKYLSGHLPDAVNLPTYRAFGGDGKLLPTAELEAWIGAAGVGGNHIPVLYDSPEGQNAAMMVWILEFLGRTDVAVLDCFFEHWKQSGREVRYRPVGAKAAVFRARENPSVRALAAEIAERPGASRLLDLRSREEFSGERTVGSDPPGHIPGAINLEWRRFSQPPAHTIAPGAEIERMLAEAGVSRGDRLITYCRSGPRAALGYLALAQLGYDVRLFDGSFAEWFGKGLPIEK